MVTAADSRVQVNLLQPPHRSAGTLTSRNLVEPIGEWCFRQRRSCRPLCLRENENAFAERQRAATVGSESTALTALRLDRGDGRIPDVQRLLGKVMPSPSMKKPDETRGGQLMGACLLSRLSK